MKDWLSLLETGVAFQTANSNDETTDSIKEAETLKEEAKHECPELNADFTQVFNLQHQEQELDLTSSEIAQEKMYGHKEGFLPPKRNLYEALTSEEGHHRFGMRDNFVDPFTPETQAFVTIPLEVNLSKIDYV